MLRVEDGRIVDERGKRVFLHGINLGGWLLIEGYLLGGPNMAEHRIRRSVQQRWGAVHARRFFEQVQKHFVQEEDLVRIKRLGLNCVRVPFNARLIESKKSQHDSHWGPGIRYLDRAVAWCRKLGLWCILDLHAAPGAQNGDWHSDGTGVARLWSDRTCQAQTVRLWRRLAQRYAHEPAIAGYDILNEPVTSEFRTLNALYHAIIAAIRATGDRHIIFLEGNSWAQELDVLEPFEDTNTAYSIHFYAPTEFTFNVVPGLTYPGRLGDRLWNKAALSHLLAPYARLARARKKPVLVGEFGVNAQCPRCGSEWRWVQDCLSLFRALGFHWTYWTYKGVAQGVFPAGLYRLCQNLPWVARDSVKRGWQTFAHLPRQQHPAIWRSLRTSSFVRQEPLARLLKRFG